MSFNFGDIVIVEKRKVGVIVKCWKNLSNGNQYDIYVRSYNGIKEYHEDNIKQFIYDKELSDEDLEFYA